MTKHVVVRRFKDQDGHIYEVGDTYPRQGRATKKRIDELANGKNKYNKVYIKEITEEME